MIRARELWATRIGLIFAVAGSAVGLGNFLRFPVQAAKNGGGAFIIPYLIAFILLGIPLMWCEWAVGRFGSTHGHGSMPGIFSKLWQNRAAKYIGVLGLFLPLTILIYYVYIESWTLAFSFFSLSGKYFGVITRQDMGSFLSSFQGIGRSPYFDGLSVAYLFFLITLIVNISVTWRGISKGIELLGKIGMPILFLMAVVLLIRIFTLGTPDPAYPERNVVTGLAYIWNPDFSHLLQAKVWLAAAGQIFFTLSVGFGSIQCYASYLKENQDIALSGLSTAMTNEFAEIILGASIAIPIAVMFFGSAATTDIANSGAFDLAFQSLPIIFQKIPIGQFFGMLWFGLLFLAGITSSVSLAQPIITFFQDEFDLSRKAANLIVWIFVFLMAQFVIIGLKGGFLDELDFWAGTFGVCLFAFVEVIIFAWIFGMPKAWAEINRGADIRIPRFFYYIIKYVTPLFLLVLFLTWFYQQGIDVLLLRDVEAGNVAWRVGARIMMLLTILGFLVLIFVSFRKRRGEQCQVK